MGRNDQGALSHGARKTSRVLGRVLMEERKQYVANRYPFDHARDTGLQVAVLNATRNSDLRETRGQPGFARFGASLTEAHELHDERLCHMAIEIEHPLLASTERLVNRERQDNSFLGPRR